MGPPGAPHNVVLWAGKVVHHGVWSSLCLLQNRTSQRPEKRKPASPQRFLITQNEKALPHFLPVGESTESNGSHKAIYLCFWQTIIITITSIYWAGDVRRHANKHFIACLITCKIFPRGLGSGSIVLHKRKPMRREGTENWCTDAPWIPWQPNAVI